MSEDAAETQSGTDPIKQLLAEIPGNWDVTASHSPADIGSPHSGYTLQSPAPGSEFDELRVHIKPGQKGGHPVAGHVPGSAQVAFELVTPAANPQVDHDNHHTIAHDTIEMTGSHRAATRDALAVAARTVKRILTELDN